jgi:hypothetical protein
MDRIDQMDRAERREVLEAIARDESAYPRDRIAAIRTLEELDQDQGRPADEFARLYELGPRRKRRSESRESRQ